MINFSILLFNFFIYSLTFFRFAFMIIFGFILMLMLNFIFNFILNFNMRVNLLFTHYLLIGLAAFILAFKLLLLV